MIKLDHHFIGFEELFDFVDKFSFGKINHQQYPPYDIVKLDENKYSISIAVAGFLESEIDIEVSKEYQKNKLSVKAVSGKKHEGDVIYKGIATRSFEKYFYLSSDTEVTSASVNNGLLTISLESKPKSENTPIKIPLNKEKKLITE